MSKWRPSQKDCIYVIADIHGRYHQFKMILNRILPLRKSDGGKDILVILGDYVDRHIDSHKVIDELIKLKSKYKEQVIFIKGNHELMMLNGLAPGIDSKKYMFWMEFGGKETLAGYIKRSLFKDEDNLEYNQEKYIENPYLYPRFRAIDLVPQAHINFLNECRLFYETDEYVFAHAGWDPALQGIQQDKETLLWGNPLYDNVKAYAAKQIPLPWKKTIVIGHYWKGPFIYDKFLMLDVSGKNEVMVMELNSREAFIAKPKKNRLVAFEHGKHFLGK